MNTTTSSLSSQLSETDSNCAVSQSYPSASASGGSYINCSGNDVTAGGNLCLICTYSLGSDNCTKRLPTIRIQLPTNTVVERTINEYNKNASWCSCTTAISDITPSDNKKQCMFYLRASNINVTYNRTTIQFTLHKGARAPKKEVNYTYTLIISIGNQNNQNGKNGTQSSTGAAALFFLTCIAIIITALMTH
jgi:hypothetical protein